MHRTKLAEWFTRHRHHTIHIITQSNQNRNVTISNFLTTYDNRDARVSPAHDTIPRVYLLVTLTKNKTKKTKSKCRGNTIIIIIYFFVFLYSVSKSQQTSVTFLRRPVTDDVAHARASVVTRVFIRTKGVCDKTNVCGINDCR